MSQGHRMMHTVAPSLNVCNGSKAATKPSVSDWWKADLMVRGLLATEPNVSPGAQLQLIMDVQFLRARDAVTAYNELAACNGLLPSPPLQFGVEFMGRYLNEVAAAVDVKQVVVSEDRISPTYDVALFGAAGFRFCGRKHGGAQEQKNHARASPV
jgi:hypothetical protein